MTTFAKQHARLTRLFEEQKRPLMEAAKLPQYAGQMFIKREVVPLRGRVELIATCSATLIDFMYTTKEPVFDEGVEQGRAGIVLDHELRFYPLPSVRLLRGWNLAQAEADDANGVERLALPTARHDGEPVAVNDEIHALLNEAAEASEALAFLKNPEQGMSPAELAVHIGWLTTPL